MVYADDDEALDDAQVNPLNGLYSCSLLQLDSFYLISLYSSFCPQEDESFPDRDQVINIFHLDGSSPCIRGGYLTSYLSYDRI
jgi:hypothetical protein